MQPFLAFSTYIDGDSPDVARKAAELAAGCTSEEEIVKNCFEFVRDSIKHSLDFQLNPVTCSASDVLMHGTGYCFAKSHLLAALLRKNGIPTGLCYQRVAIGSEGTHFCLHGLNAVYLKNHGWYRMDARGNKPGVNAQFTPPKEVLAFTALVEPARDLPEILSEPLPQVVHALTTYKTVLDVAKNLPDVDHFD
ncbi:MAG: transglutaminase-like domain-containing protein [Burkholderiaceae bacterium]